MGVEKNLEVLAGYPILGGTVEESFAYLAAQQGAMAYGAIFGLLILAGLGVPISEDLPIIAAGYLVWSQTVSAPLVFGVILIGVLIGDSFLYGLGRKLGGGWLERKALTQPKIGRMQGKFQRFGDRVVFAARFLPGFRAPTYLLAGATKIRYTRFLAWDGSAACISIPLWMGLGYLLGTWFGSEISALVEAIQQIQGRTGVIALGVVATALTIYLTLTYLKKPK